MSISFTVLGSGSAGNASLVVLPGPAGTERRVLIDAGLGPRTTGRRLAAFGLGVEDLTDILLTHLDRDHFRPTWARTLQRIDCTVHIHRRHRTAAFRSGVPPRRARVFDGDFDLGPRTRVETVRLAHDALGSVGYVIEHDGTRLGWATDLGRVPDALHDRFVGLHGLALESNYDRRLQVASPRPSFLKSRIMGGAGHLSNDQALDAVERIAGRSRLSQLALLHLSRECNDARIVVRACAERVPHLLDVLTVTGQYTPTPMLEVHRDGVGPEARPLRVGEQMFMFESA